MRHEVTRTRYGAVAIALHWSMAIGILALLAIGLVMAHADLSPQRLFGLYQLHKSIGMTILLAGILRLGWRLGHRPPPLPAGISPAERAAASTTHGILYLFLIGLPLTGWALVSVSPLGIPTVLYGVLPWPHLPWLQDVADKARAEKLFETIHAYGAYAIAAVVAMHAAAALRHHFVLRDAVLRRMLPGRRSSAAEPDREIRR